ncbi:hypothetical protein SAMN05216391_108130 [Lachnospiraceae bacterium KHCPX20]|nr:hypothetical protein SAMN05216391_108130 [Lachnospiraceae bacterium KHCPX20]
MIERTGNEIVISFEDETYLEGAEGVYTVNPAPEWASLDTWQYEGKNCLVSTNHTASHVGDISFNIKLIKDGTLEFNYVSESENGYDYLIVYIDNNQVYSSMGSNHKDFTLVSKDMTKGNHIVKFSYRKDGSGDSGKDAVGIGYIKFTGVEENVIRKFLVCDSDNKLYTITDGTLTDTGSTIYQLSSSLFMEKGFEKKAFDYQLMKDLDGLKIYQWLDKERIKKINVTATPNQQIIEGIIELTDPTVLGLSSVSVKGAGITIAYSVNGTTFTEYMNLDSFAAIDLDTLYANATQKKIWVKIQIPEGSSFNGIFFNCVNEKGDS